MTCAELNEWKALWEIEPWGVVRDDAYHGILCSTVANAAFGSSGGNQPSDFTPRFVSGPQKPMDTEAVKAGFKAHAAMGKGMKSG